VTRSAWDGLSPAGREALTKAAARAAERMRRERDRLDDSAVEAMRKRGLQVHTLTPQLESEWRRLAETAYPKIRGGMVPADMFDAAQEAIAEFRRTSPAGATQ
jgi:TRAP-type C4-dicarboxylate transport system substrate-binding protein